MTKPNDCKNLTFDAVSFFLLNVFNRCRLAKNMSLVYFISFRTSISRYHYRITLSMSLSYIQSNGESSLRENRAIDLIHNAKRQIHNAPYDD